MNTAWMPLGTKPSGTVNWRDALRSWLRVSARVSTKPPSQCENTLPFAAVAFHVAFCPALHVFGAVTVPSPARTPPHRSVTSSVPLAVVTM